MTVWKTTLLLAANFVASVAHANGGMAAEMAEAFKNAMKDGLKGGDENVRLIGAERPIIQWDESDESVPTVNAGIVTTLSSSFFDDYDSLVMDIFSDEIRNMKIEDYCTEQSIGTMVGHMCVSN